MKITWAYDRLTDKMHLIVNDRIEEKITLREMIDVSAASYSYDFALYDLVMVKIKAMVWLSMPGHE